MSRRSWTDEQLRVAVEGSVTYTEVIGKLGLSVTAAGNWRTVQKYVKLLELDTAHFVDRYSSANTVKATLATTIPIHEILVEGSTYSTSSLLRRLVKAGLKDRKCERCKLDKWLGEDINLEVDHINGINDDHRIENLRVLCPNCHSFTPTWRGRNRGIKYLCACGETKFKTSKVCATCAKVPGNVVRKTKISWPEREEILDKLKCSTYDQVGKDLGVSGNAVRKYLKRTAAPNQLP